jgi:Antistasin family
MERRRLGHRFAWTMPVLVAVPFLTGADGPGCGGTVFIGSGASGNDAGSGGGVTADDAGSVSDSAGTCMCTGPAPGAPTVMCSDGSLGGPVCGQHADGTCAWTLRSCPPSSDSCPALGCFPNCPGGVLKDSNGCDTCTCAPVDAGSTSVCTTNADCPNGGPCGFLESEGCAAIGHCFPAPTGARCAIPSSIGCGCSGSDVSIDPSCYSGLPSGYQTKPVLHAGACTDASTSGLKWYWTCGDPVCQVPTSDAGLKDDAGTACPPVGSSCPAKGETCGTRNASTQCGAIEECDDQNPAVMCPVSSRRFKNGIEYVDGARLAQLHDEAMRIRLATYNYKPEVADPKPRHLGFIIEDMPQSPAVEASQSRVDMYGYMSMVVAAMQVQEKEIEDLRRELDRARAGVCEGTDPRGH